MILQKTKYSLHQAIHHIWQYRGRNSFSLIIICLSFLILGIFLSLANNLQHLSSELSRNMRIIFFLEPNLSSQKLKSLEEAIGKFSFVKEVRYIGAEQALQRFQKNFPELKEILKSLDSNPFPASLEAILIQKLPTSADIHLFIEQIRKAGGVEDVQFNRDWIEKMESLSRLVKAVGLFLGGILILASFFIISNVIKLNVLAYKNEIEILRLVGATNNFIRIPFLLEGIFLGILGSILSLFLLVILIELFPLYVGGSLGILQEIFQFRFLSRTQSFSLIAGGATIGFLGSLSSLSKFLKI